MPSLSREHYYKSALTILFVAVIYATTGYIGLYLAPPPGYATAIWIPSGIALGAVLIWGLGVLPGIFIGSLITNFFITTTVASDGSWVMPLIVGVMIASGATLQAYMGWWLIRRFVGLHNLLNEPNDILLFALLAGPISCLVNATWSNTGLVFLNILSINNYPIVWLTWWIGDSMGVLIFAPVFLILFANPRMIWRQRIIPILSPLTLSFIAISLTFIVIHQSEMKRLQSSFERVAMSRSEQIEERYREGGNNKNKDIDIEQILKEQFPNQAPFSRLSLNKLSKASEKHITSQGSNELRYQKVITIQNQPYLFIAEPSVKYINNEFRWQTWFVLVSGLLFCALMNVVLFILNGQKSLAQVGMAETVFALRKAESENSLILRAAGEGIYGVDANGCVTFINPAAAKMLGYSEDELIGKPIHELIHHSHPDGTQYKREDCYIYLTAHFNKTYHISNEVYWRKDGSQFWVDYTATPLIDGHQTSGAVVIFNDITKRKETELELERLALIDPLTSLPNRISFLKKLQQDCETSRQNNSELTVCLIDIDNFKQVNDTVGPSLGDDILKKLADLIKPNLPEDSYVARIGGDEFGIIIYNIADENTIVPLLDKLNEAIKIPINFNQIEISLTISMGLAMYGVAGFDAEELMRNVEIAIYYAKESGKGFYEFYDEEIHRIIKRQNHIEMLLRQALNKQEFSLEYQCQVDANGQLSGVETLLRWYSPELAEVSPEEFIPIAEKSGLIYNIGEWVIRKACEDYKKMAEVMANPFVLSINVSIIQLENTHFSKSLEKIMSETEMVGENLLLEITETALMRNPDYTLRVMNHVKLLGVRFALDDFGMSYSSLQYLKKLPVSFIKIDKGFIKDMPKSNSDEKIVNASIQLSKVLGIHSIAEGVETAEQFKMLVLMGCEYMQGFYFARPVDINELLKSKIFTNA